MFRSRSDPRSRSRLIPVTLSLALAAATAQATPARASEERHAVAACGVELWSLKTLSDPQKNLVRLRPIPTTIRAINARPMPNPIPTTRNTVFERRVWRVKAQIVEFKLEGDGDIHLLTGAQGKL
jgi:hypothetical protein